VSMSSRAHAEAVERGEATPGQLGTLDEILAALPERIPDVEERISEAELEQLGQHVLNFCWADEEAA
jgi:hypothetical protein